MNYSGKIFISAREAAKLTGVSYPAILKGCNDGSIPHIVSGNKFLINAPMLIEKLNEESRKVARA